MVPAAHGADAELFPVDFKAYVFKVAGKHVANVPFEAALTGLSADAADLTCASDTVALFDNVKLRFDPPGADPIEEVYGKVVGAESLADGRSRRRVRFTSVPDPGRLGSLLPLTPAG